MAPNINDYLPTPAPLADANVDIGGKSKTDVAIDNSDHNVIDWTVNLEQTMGTVVIVLAILAALYCIRYGFNSICYTARIHFGKDHNDNVSQWPQPPSYVGSRPPRAGPDPTYANTQGFPQGQQYNQGRIN